MYYLAVRYIYVIPVQFITVNDWKTSFHHILTFIPFIITNDLI